MTLKSEYIREEERFSKERLKNLLNLDDESFKIFINRLKNRNVLKIVDKSTHQDNYSDLLDEDLDIFEFDMDYDRYDYKFTFVGILIVGKVILKCYPKYLLSNKKPFEELKEILKVLNKYNSKKQIIKFFNDDVEKKGYNLLSVILYIINDYVENGVYKNQQELIEINGEGEILWDNTINDTFALIINNIPYYIELLTESTINNENDYFTRLHKWIITDCCRKLKHADLLDLFEIENIHLSDEDIESFGGKNYILYKLGRELNNQFVTRNQTLLKVLSLYILHRKYINDDYGLSMYGTTSFEYVWENACAEVFDNQLSVALNDLNLPIELHEDYNSKKSKNLLKIIDTPIWKPKDSENPVPKEEKHSLKPDLISFFETDNGWYFCIFDAKYYNIIFDKNELENYPGVADVTKQFLYQLAYNDFIRDHEFACIKNAFLMPAESDNHELLGQVEMKIFNNIKPPLEKILVIKLSARTIYKHYLTGCKINIDKELGNILKENFSNALLEKGNI